MLRFVLTEKGTSVIVSNQRGFTLIEALLAIVILAIAMAMMITVMFPQARESGEIHYQARSAALANAVLSEVLARSFDENSDHNGGNYRCGDTGSNVITPVPACKTTLGPDSGELDPNGGLIRDVVNDVDDYIGCWADKASDCDGLEPYRGKLNNVVGSDIALDYPHFRLNISVVYDNGLTGGEDIAGKGLHKLVTTTIWASRFGPYEYKAYRSNY